MSADPEFGAVAKAPAQARDRDESGRGVLASALRAPEWGLIAGILVILGVIYFVDPSRQFFSEYSRKNVVHDCALYGVLALGAAIVIISGGIDLSVGSVVALSGVVCVKMLGSWEPYLAKQITGALTFIPWLPKESTAASITFVVGAIAATLLMGLVVGLLHALMINQLRLPPFIATLATMAGLRSVAIVLAENRTARVNSDMFRALGKDNIFSVPIFLALAVAMSVVMGWTVLGRHLFALGGNETAARLSGLRTNRLKAVAYCLSGVLAAIGGILFTGNTGGSDPVNMGKSYELYAITAAVVGGCSLSGGIGSIRGTVLGLILLQIVIKGTGLVVKGIDPSQIEGLVLGTVVVLAVGFNQRFRARR
jgi:ribose/xylose/arabinose/galactoside ABC-type transport system permease subunit